MTTSSGARSPALGVRAATARWLTTANPAGLMHGAVVTGAVLALVTVGDSTSTLAIGTLSVLVVYWLTHAYTDALGRGLGGDRNHLTRRLLHCGRRESTVLLGGLPALLTVWLFLGLGADLTGSVDAGLWVTVALLAAVGCWSARASGITGWRLAAETAFAGLVGTCIVGLHTFLH